MTRSLEIRPATAGEMEQVGLMAAYVYGGAFGDGPDNVTATSIAPEWTLCAFDGPVLATSFATFPFTMRANGNAVAFGGVTAVGTLPEYRRQGLLRRIMSASMAQQREQGRAVSGLWASQAAIYQRYGYAAAGCNRTYRIDTPDIQFNAEHTGTCAMSRLMLPEAMDVAKTVYREFIGDKMGYLHRSQPLWRNNAFAHTDETGPVYLALASQGGLPRGYVTYTLRANKVEHRARSQEIRITDMAWLDLDAYVSMWQFLAAHDLVGRVVWTNAPMDDPAPLLMREPRLLHTMDQEGSWIRLVDVAQALAERGYASEVGSAGGSAGGSERTLRIGVGPDALCPWNEGTWALAVDRGNAEVRATTEPPDVELSVQALSLLYTGMSTARELQRWGMLRGSAAAVAEAERLFVTRARPHCPDHY